MIQPFRAGCLLLPVILSPFGAGPWLCGASCRHPQPPLGGWPPAPWRSLALSSAPSGLALAGPGSPRCLLSPPLGGWLSCSASRAVVATPPAWRLSRAARCVARARYVIRARARYCASAKIFPRALSTRSLGSFFIFFIYFIHLGGAEGVSRARARVLLEMEIPGDEESRPSWPGI